MSSVCDGDALASRAQKRRLTTLSRLLAKVAEKQGR
jgi:hypothetical protein